ncbi:hypothetical protein GQ55_6G054500 [Panicum hallii var. hallii]|uniref:BED-type domain-containing protein n=1 Tax=Panicum hallii var. hallii TaxID=1504633 RepID=A0A2T7D4A4_9POAL|nr:hypothetical protein GQ55_6G054500 [Panicum hallii var. hallii]
MIMIVITWKQGYLLMVTQDSEKKKSSKIWDMYKPVAVNEGIHRMECRSCHANFSYKGGQLWRYHKSCKAKEALGPSQQQQNADLPFGYLSCYGQLPTLIVLHYQ